MSIIGIIVVVSLTVLVLCIGFAMGQIAMGKKVE